MERFKILNICRNCRLSQSYNKNIKNAIRFSPLSKPPESAAFWMQTLLRPVDQWIHIQVCRKPISFKTQIFLVNKWLLPHLRYSIITFSIFLWLSENFIPLDSRAYAVILKASSNGTHFPQLFVRNAWCMYFYFCNPHFFICLESTIQALISRTVHCRRLTTRSWLGRDQN